MLAAQRNFQPCVDFRTLEGASTAVKQNIADLSSSGNYYVTPEICRELRHIDAGANHIRLDHDLLTNVPAWHKEANPSTVSVHRQGATKAFQVATETLLDLKQRMQRDRYHGQQDNEGREDHHSTIQDLKDVETDMRPYAHDSVVRLKQYCDRVGVTDRYTGYRNNLNRGNRNPIELAFSWLDPKYRQPNATNIKLRMQSDKIHHRTECGEIYGDRLEPESARGVSSKCRMNPCIKPLSIEEQCGINMTFPGTTEYIDRYVAPRRDGPTADYVINPTPDYRINGRPMARQRFLCTESEYERRYQWPDGERIMKFPWLRK